MSLRVYNTLTKEKEIFTPVRPGKVGIYLCGPTVYKSPHIGHMVGPVVFDAIKRYLQYKGYDVQWVVNITDVEDKLIDAAAKQNSTVQALADKYTAEYHEALASLGIDNIDKFPKASEHMTEIVDLCKKLIAKGIAYAADGNVWFDVTKDADYGKLSNRRVEDQESGLRQLEGSGKKNPADFALWKAAKPGEPSWDSPWGKGRPGWHIECSAMSMKYLGETFDMHGGGMDLMFPHHENELAQSESATGKTFAKFWMHNGLTKMRTKLASGEWADEKMSGSIGNVISVKELIGKHGAPLVRYMLLMTHYRRPIDFSDEVVTAAKKGLSNFDRLFERVDRLTGKVEGKPAELERISAEMLQTAAEPFVKAVMDLKMKFLDSMDDDFNTAGAIGVLQQLAGEVNSYIEQTGVEKDKAPESITAIAAGTQTLRALGALLGLFKRPVTASASAAPKAAAEEKSLADQLMQLIIQLRATAREKKDFATADAIRDGLAKLKITVEDRADGTTWRKE
jgi:cysteinyl-tRNA synthetase